MIALLPFHKLDAEQAVKTITLSGRLNFTSNHQFVGMYPNDTPQDLVNEVEAAARAAFEVVEIIQIPHDIPNEWPAGPNKMFATGCAYMRQGRPFEKEYKGDYHEQNGAFLWWEPDFVPTQPNWLDRFQQEYNLSGKPCLGVVVPTIKQDVLQREVSTQRDPIDNSVPLGKPIKFGNKKDHGPHMVGAGIYDRSISRLITWIDAAGGLSDPFDVTLKDEICQMEGGSFTRVIPTKLIAHFWKSKNYKLVKQGDLCDVTCEVRELTNGEGVYTEQVFQLSNNTYIGPAAVHGCKDDSIYEVIEQINGLRSIEQAAASRQIGLVEKLLDESLVNEKEGDKSTYAHQGRPFKITSGNPKEETQVTIGGKYFKIPTDKATSITLAEMERLEAEGIDPMLAIYPLTGSLLKEALAPTNTTVTHSIVQSSGLTDSEHDDDDLSPEEMRIFAKLQAKLDRRTKHKKKAKKSKSAPKKISVVKKPVRQLVDEEAVWKFYSEQPESVAWKATLKTHRISPRQLKEIREKNQVVA